MVYAIVILVAFFLQSCTTETASNGALRPTITTPTATPGESAGELCEHLNEMRTMPYNADETAGDPIYDGLMAAGNAAVPCLIGKIIDTTPMQDPSSSPSVGNYRVGDAAVFMLYRVTHRAWDPEGMLSSEYARRWKSNGIFAYFEYVEKPANRRKVQAWWQAWWDSTKKS